MKKILILIIIAVVGTQNFVHLHAQTAIFVQPKNGEQVAFPLSEKPTITFENSTMTIQSQSFALGDIQNLSFKNSGQTRVAKAMAWEQLQVYPNPVINGQLTIYNLQLTANSNPLSIEIYDMNGNRVYVASVGALHATPSQSDNQMTINISHLRSGTYIVKIGTSTGSVSGSAKIVKQ